MDALHRDHPGHGDHALLGAVHVTDPAVTPERRDELARGSRSSATRTTTRSGCTSIRGATSSRPPASPASPTSRRSTRPTTRRATRSSSRAYERAADGHAAQSARDDCSTQRGLGTPKTFRAGGWTATPNTLLALADNGYIADTSALNWDVHRGMAAAESCYAWNMTHWSPISDTSQPYHPSTD